MRVRADKEVCATTGQCALTAPEVFGLDEDGTVSVLDPLPARRLHQGARVAARHCPVEAIEIEDDDPAVG